MSSRVWLTERGARRRSWPGPLAWVKPPGLFVARPGVVVTEWRVTLGNHSAEALGLEALDPAAIDAAACIGCGACVAACPNGSAMLFTAAKVAHLGSLTQGHPERHSRVLAMVDAMDQEGFGSCSNYAECEAVCPKGIRIKTIADMNREYLRANVAELTT